MANQNGIDRRQALGAGLGAALAAPRKRGSIRIGMATTEFRKHSNAQLAKELSAAGIRVIQLFFTQTDSRYWRYNQRADLSDMTADRCRTIADAYRSTGISIDSMGVYPNLIHPDEAERKANFAYFETMMKLGGYMGVRKFVSEPGHYTPKPGEPHVEGYNFQEDVWKRMVATGKELGRIADGYGATVLLESHFMSFLSSAKRTRTFLEEVNSPRVRALLDPANLLEHNDLEEMFNQLGPYIGGLHAKDRKLHVIRGVGAGEGDLDYRKYVTLAATRTPGLPLFLEYVGAATYKQALAHLRNAIKSAGLTEA